MQQIIVSTSRLSENSNGVYMYSILVKGEDMKRAGPFITTMKLISVKVSFICHLLQYPLMEKLEYDEKLYYWDYMFKGAKHPDV